jgi:hypothetical protein
MRRPSRPSFFRSGQCGHSVCLCVTAAHKQKSASKESLGDYFAATLHYQHQEPIFLASQDNGLVIQHHDLVAQIHEEVLVE